MGLPPGAKDIEYREYRLEVHHYGLGSGVSLPPTALFRSRGPLGPMTQKNEPI